MKLLVLVPLMFLTLGTAMASTSYSAKIDCSSRVHEEIVIHFSSNRGSIVITESGGTVSNSAPKMKINKGFSGTKFSLNLRGRDSFKMLISNFAFRSGNYTGKAEFKIGNHIGASVDCRMNYVSSSAAKASTSKTKWTPNPFAGSLNTEGLALRLSQLPLVSGNFCAGGVQLSLNKLFSKKKSIGRNAKDYTEALLTQWQTPEARYKELHTITDYFIYPHQDFDIRVLQPAQTCGHVMARKYGHIEFFYQGVWYSDFKQEATGFDGDAYHAANTPGYKRCYSSMTVYRLSGK